MYKINSGKLLFHLEKYVSSAKASKSVILNIGEAKIVYSTGPRSSLGQFVEEVFAANAHIK